MTLAWRITLEKPYERLLHAKDFLVEVINDHRFDLIWESMKAPADCRGAVYACTTSCYSQMQVKVCSRSYWQDTDWLDPYPRERQHILQAIDNHDRITEIVIVGTIPVKEKLEFFIAIFNPYTSNHPS